MILKTLLLASAIVAVQGTFLCPAFELFVSSFCSDKCSDMGKGCNLLPTFGCFCFLTHRRLNGVCVPKNSCCTGQNEVYAIKGSDRKCEDLGRTFIYPRTEGCFCKPGTVRDKDRKCVPIDECRPKCPGQNEEYRKDACDKICGVTSIQNCTPSPLSRCLCKEGFIRKNGICIEVSKCKYPKCSGQNEEYKKIGCDKICGDESIQICKPTAKPGCFCKVGFIRKNGICIQESKCEYPKCPGQNEQYKKFGCDRICGDDVIENCTPIAVPRCLCKDGFIRKNGTCIQESQCEYPKCSGQNEQYKKSGCDKKCDIDGTGPGVCILGSGCFCLPGYVRQNGICIMPNQCEYPKCSGQNEVYKINSCDKKCDSDVTGPSICKPTTGCLCKDGFVRQYGICIDPTQCEKPKCYGQNEEYQKTGCDKICLDGSIQNCSSSPLSGCYCKQGFLRLNGTCTDQSKCEYPKCNGQNEEYRLSSCDKKCDIDVNGTAICNLTSGCFCIKGFVRQYGICINPTQCEAPKCYGQNEEYKKNSCDKKCDSDVSGPGICKPTTGCLCKDGFVRQYGICIDPSQCEKPKCYGQNEEYQKTGCDKVCLDGSIQDCSSSPLSGCYCKQGFLRLNGTCTDQSKCEYPKCNGQNEEYRLSSCDKKCDIDVNGTAICNLTSGCFCIKGFVRQYGICINPTQCEAPKCYGQHEEYKKNSCDKKCDSDVSGPGICKPSTGCLCKDGFVRKYGICIDPTQCEKPKCYGQNEEYQKTGCDKICLDGSIQDCSSSPLSGCYCKQGFLRVNGTCTDQSKCEYPKCNGQNEEYRLSSCDKKCDIDVNGTAICDLSRGCFCIKGYVRQYGICIKPSQCEAPKCYGQNEEYKKNSCDKKCDSDVTGPSICQPTTGCLCKDGFVRQYGICIDPSQCEKPKCYGQNEEYQKTGCDKICLDGNIQNCSSSPLSGCYCKQGFLRLNGTCTDQSKCEYPKCNGQNEEYRLSSCDKKCDIDVNGTAICNLTRGCFCIKGYVRQYGICIKPSQCEAPKCYGQNEEYKKNSCDQKCDSDVTGPSICKPTTGCLCKDGFVRQYGICIDPTQCEKPKCYGQNEEYQKTGCDKICLDGSIQECSSSPLSGCYCKQGFVRLNGTCTDQSKCEYPKCNGQNEEYRISGCDKKCDIDVNGTAICNLTRGCFCIKGFVRQYGICINPTQCEAPKCYGQHEEYKKNSCDKKCDSDVSGSGICKPTTGCFCKKGYVRQYGICIKPNACEYPKCPGQNEEYKINACDRKCNVEVDCKPSKGCVCKKGFAREDGICINEKDCKLPECYGENEEYKSDGCDKSCNGIGEGICSSAPGCFCKEGFIRNNGTCRDPSECECGDNQEYVLSGGCDKVCNNKGGNEAECASSPGCFCKQGFIRNNDDCVDPSECECGDNQEYLISDGCDKDCNDNDLECPGPSKCYCKEGFRRNSNDKCVTSNECNECMGY